jgi:hypothetical protein
MGRLLLACMFFTLMALLTACVTKGMISESEPTMESHPLTKEGILMSSEPLQEIYNNIMTLKISNFTITSFDFLADFPDAYEIYISRCYVIPDILPPEDNLLFLNANGLVILDMFETDAVVLANMLLPHMPNVDSLRFQGFTYSDESLICVPTLESVSLTIPNPVAVLKNNMHITFIYMGLKGSIHAGQESYENYIKSMEGEYRNIDGIGGFKRLEHMVIEGGLTNISEIAGSESLKILWLDTVALISLEPLYGLVNLDTVYLISMDPDTLPEDVWEFFYHGVTNPDMVYPPKRLDKPTIYFQSI